MVISQDVLPTFLQPTCWLPLLTFRNLFRLKDHFDVKQRDQPFTHHWLQPMCRSVLGRKTRRGGTYECPVRAFCRIDVGSLPRFAWTQITADRDLVSCATR